MTQACDSSDYLQCIVLEFGFCSMSSVPRAVGIDWKLSFDGHVILC
jgi:hypothetical protein